MSQDVINHFHYLSEISKINKGLYFHDHNAVLIVDSSMIDNNEDDQLPDDYIDDY